MHFQRLQRLHAQGVMILVGPTLGPVNTGIAIFEAPDEASARRIMNEDPCSLAATPAVSSGRSESRFSAVEMGRVLPRDHLVTAQCYESRSIPSAVTEVSA